jgi:hypothetical protein
MQMHQRLKRASILWVWLFASKSSFGPTFPFSKSDTCTSSNVAEIRLGERVATVSNVTGHRAIYRTNGLRISHGWSLPIPIQLMACSVTVRVPVR